MAEVQMAAMRAPRSRSIGGARHRSYLSSVKHGNPVAVRWVNHWQADREGSGYLRREQDGQEANGGSRKAAGKQEHMTEPSEYGRSRITGRIPGPVPGPERELT